MSCGLMASLIIEASQTDALVATQVTPALHRAKTVRTKQLTYRRGLVEAMLQQQPAACFKIARSPGQDKAKILEPPPQPRPPPVLKKPRARGKVRANSPPPPPPPPRGRSGVKTPHLPPGPGL